jgi:hypothetical protein
VKVGIGAVHVPLLQVKVTPTFCGPDGETFGLVVVTCGTSTIVIVPVWNGALEPAVLVAVTKQLMAASQSVDLTVVYEVPVAPLMGVAPRIH